MSAPPLISVDFSGRRAPLTLASTVLLIAGALAIAGAFVEYRRLEAARAGLELKRDAANRHAHHDPAQETRNRDLTQEIGKVVTELTTPWTRLLAELEGAISRCCRSSRMSPSTSCTSRGSRVTCRAYSPTWDGCRAVRCCAIPCSTVTRCAPRTRSTRCASR